MNEDIKQQEPQGNGVLPCVMPCFCIGDKVYHNGRKMEAKIVSLYENTEPNGTPCDFWCDIEFIDGVIWISQDATFNEDMKGNTTMYLLNKA